MAENKAGNTVRSVIARVMATSILLGMYSVGTVVVTGGLTALTMSTATAQWRGRGRGRGRGWGRGWNRGRGWGRGKRGRGRGW
jgi:hypothetical protein